AIWAKGHVAVDSALRIQGSPLLTSSRIPQFHLSQLLVPPGDRCEQLPVRAIGDRGYPSRMPPQGLNNLAGRDIPYPDRFIGAGRGELSPAGVIGNGSDPLGVPTQSGQLRVALPPEITPLPIPTFLGTLRQHELRLVEVVRLDLAVRELDSVVVEK